MPETFLALLTAHLLGDFVFQSNRMVKPKTNLFVLLLHVCIITVATSVTLGSMHRWIVMAVFCSHLLCDLIKTRCSDTALPFVLDQLAHVAVAALLAFFWPDASANGWWPTAWQDRLPQYHAALCFVSGVVLVVPVGGILIAKLTAPISTEIKESKLVLENVPPPSGNGRDTSSSDYLTEGLKNGGKYIGWLERSLTLLLVLIGQPTGIGFLITAKSILRFGEIKESKHRKLAEYIIIGTFLSFGWALLMSVLMQRAMGHWTPKEEPAPKPVRVILDREPTGTSSETATSSTPNPVNADGDNATTDVPKAADDGGGTENDNEAGVDKATDDDHAPRQDSQK